MENSLQFFLGFDDPILVRERAGRVGVPAGSKSGLGTAFRRRKNDRAEPPPRHSRKVSKDLIEELARLTVAIGKCTLWPSHTADSRGAWPAKVCSGIKSEPGN
jgi:hypothetical protein